MLMRAIELLSEEPGLTLVATSQIYETEPVGPPQPSYLNAAARFDTTLDPHAVLEILLRVERTLGRIRGEKWGPRTIDLDILWMDGVAISDATLTVPHPHLMERTFALAPLSDVAPELEWARARCEELGGKPPAHT